MSDEAPQSQVRGGKGETEEPGSFWKSFPGAVTAAAGLISAVAALVGGLVAVGVIGGSRPVPGSAISPAAVTHSSIAPSAVPSSNVTSAAVVKTAQGGGTQVGGTPPGPVPGISTPATATATASPSGTGTPTASPSTGATSAGPPPVLVDQVNDPAWTGGAVTIEPVNRDSQVFTPSLPHLIAIEVALITVNAGRGGDTVTLTVVDGSGVQIATASAAIAEGWDGFWRFSFPDGGPPVTPGQPLTISVQDTGKSVFGWKYVPGNPYPRGQAEFNGSTFGANDFLFRTYGAQE